MPFKYTLENYLKKEEKSKKIPYEEDTQQHHFEERAVFVGCGVRAVGTKELPLCVGGGGEE